MPIIQASFFPAAICLVFVKAVASPCLAGESQPGKLFDLCRNIAETDLRLKCIKKLMAQPPESRASGPSSPWRLTLTNAPPGGREVISIIKTASSRSSPDFAGIIIRCADPAGLEVVVATVAPFPPKMKRKVSITAGSEISQLIADSGSGGSALVLPPPAEEMARGTWLSVPEVAVDVIHNSEHIAGTVQTAGLASALIQLSESCANRQ